MNRFSDAGSTPAVSSGSAAAELGYVYCKSDQHPTTVEFVRCVELCHSKVKSTVKRCFFLLLLHFYTAFSLIVSSPQAQPPNASAGIPC